MMTLPLLLVFQSLNFVLMHWHFVNEGSLLWPELEAQLRGHCQVRRDEIHNQIIKYGELIEYLQKEETETDGAKMEETLKGMWLFGGEKKDSV